MSVAPDRTSTLAAIDDVEERLRAAQELLRERDAPQRVVGAVLRAEDDVRRARAALADDD